MDKERITLLAYSVAVGLAIIIGLIFFRAAQDPDVYFAHSIFSGLVNGKESVEGAIDWPHFLALGSDIGADYTRFLTEFQKAYFRKGFIINFSMSFKNAGGQLSSFGDWHIYGRDKDKSMVACSTLGKKSVLFTVSKKSGKRKLVSIQWKEPQ